jgi:hypothetical protein
MSDKRKVNVRKSRNVITYTEFWHTSYCLLEKGQKNAEGSFHQFMASLVFTAFSFEAYLNHIGPKIFRCWDCLDRLGPKEKLAIIAEKIGLEVDYGKRPWGILKELFGFRNDIAHGKSRKVDEDKVVPIVKYDEHMRAFAKTDWERFCTRQNAERARNDVEAMVEALHNAAGIKDEFAFVSGMQEAFASLIDEKP